MFVFVTSEDSIAVEREHNTRIHLQRRVWGGGEPAMPPHRWLSVADKKLFTDVEIKRQIHHRNAQHTPNRVSNIFRQQ